MAALKGQPAPKPGSLGKPVPGADEDAQIAELLASFDAPKAAAAPSDEDAAIAEIVNQAAGQGQEFAPEPSFAQANLEQFNPQNFMDRLRTGLAANDTEKVAFLKQKYGEGNVTQDKGKIWYRRDPKDKLKPLDPATLELISDIIPDFAREIVTEGAMLPAEVGMGIVGGAAGGLAGAGVGAVAGRVASVPMANATADAVAQFAGVPQDPERNQRMENAIGMGAEAVLPVVGRRVVNQVAKRIPGTMAYKAAREAGEKEVVALSNQSQDVYKAFEKLEEEGRPLQMSLEQLQPGSPKIQKLGDKASRNGESGAFLNKQEEVNKGYEAALTNTINDIKRLVNPKGPIPGGSISKSISSAIDDLDKAEGEAIGNFRSHALAKLGNQKQQLPEETSQSVVDLMKELGFRPVQRQIKIARKVATPGQSGSVVNSSLARESRNYSEGVFRGGGTGPGAGKSTEVTVLKPRIAAKQRIVGDTITRQEWLRPKEMLQGRLGLTEGQVPAMINALDDYGKLIARGNEARLSDVETLIKRMGPLTQKLRGTEGGAHLGRIVGELRQHRRQLIESTLDKGSYEDTAFKTIMDDFSMRRANVDTLRSVLDKDMSAKSVANYFFGEGSDRERITVLKKLLGENSHQFGALKEEWLNQQMIEYGSKAGSPTRFNSEGFLKALTKNETFAKEVMNTKAGPNFETIKNMLTVGQRIEAIQRGVKADEASDKVAKGMANMFVGWLGRMPSRMLNGASTLLGIETGEQKALMELFNRNGYEKYLAEYRGKGDKKVMAKQIESMLVRYNAARAGSRKIEALHNVGKGIVKGAVKVGKGAGEVGKRGTRATIREDVMRSDN